jgi:hypothetical protein
MLQRTSVYPSVLAAVATLLCAAIVPGHPSRADQVRFAGEGAAAPRGDGGGRDTEHRARPTYARSNYVWPYATGPSYGNAAARGARRGGVLHTSVGRIDLRARPLPFPEALTTADDLDRLGRQVFVVQLDPTSLAEGALTRIESAIDEHGGAVLRRLPVASLIARMTPAARQSIQDDPGLLLLEPYHAALKLDPTIGRVPLLDPVLAIDDVYDLDVRLFDGEDAALAADAIGKLGGTVTAVYPDTVRAEIHRARLGAVARLESVYMIHEHAVVLPHGEETTTTVQTGRYNSGATPYHDAGVDGGGAGLAPPQLMTMVDTGLQLDAGDLSDTRVSEGTPGPDHRKVRAYVTTEPFGGQGDLLGCDASISGGYTHGHLVAATAVGKATAVEVASYGAPWLATDDRGRSWKLDGVAPGALLAAYDAQPTPLVGSCGDPQKNTLTPGDLYSGGSSGSLGDGYATYGAKVFNLSWGGSSDTYETHAEDVDTFLADHPDALVFVSVGNAGGDDDNDDVPDPATMVSPATAKNALAVGASGAPNDTAGGGGENRRAYFSGTGPAPANRVAPQVMAPGDDSVVPPMGLPSAYGCRSSDNDQAGPVECDPVSGIEGTSYSSAAASGAALLVRDYFAQGFYPDGSSTNPGNAAEQVADVSGPLIKALIVASAEFIPLATQRRPPWYSPYYVSRRRAWSEAYPWVTLPFRFNNEQGYGRLQLDNVLPLQSWPASVSGLQVVDGGVDGGVAGIDGLDGIVNTVTHKTDVGSFDVCHSDEELRVALAWFDSPGQALLNDLDLEVVSPSGVVYHGNYFTDDDDRDGTVDPLTEDCPGIGGTTGEPDASAWSLPACERSNGTSSPHDFENPTEAVFLSPDPLGDGSASQIEIGTWTVRVVGASGMETSQRYAVAVSGGVCVGSWARLDRSSYPCNGAATVTILEKNEPGDTAPTAGEVAQRTMVQVLDGTTIVDQETDLPFFVSGTQANRFDSTPVVLTVGTAYDPGNGVLDVRDGNTIRVVYADVGPDGITPDPDRQRIATAVAACSAQVASGGITIAQYGQDLPFRVRGGCERNARDSFEYGFPDHYLDAGETLTVDFAIASDETADLLGVEFDLRCAIPDADSPADCAPDSTVCADPGRTNNPSCDQRPSGQSGDAQYMAILNTTVGLGRLPLDSAITVSFGIQMAPTIPGTPEVELILSVRSDASGKPAAGLAVSRHRLDVDELSLFYSTDFPSGGTEYVDVDNDEVLSDPTTDLVSLDDDYRFETLTWSDLTAGGTKNLVLQSPWNFDTSDGGFRSGILTSTDRTTITNVIAQWGEDLNFNNLLDGACQDDPSLGCQRDSDCPTGACGFEEDRDPLDATLNRSWNIRGGCGWQTRPPGTCSGLSTQGCYDDGDCPSGQTCSGPSSTGGIWHTGRIGGTSGSCLSQGLAPGRCQSYEVVGGTTGTRSWHETLVTPVMHKVNDSGYRVEILQWAWNQTIDLEENAALAWEFDTDTSSLSPVDLYADETFLNVLSDYYGFGAVTGGRYPDWTDGYGLFAPLDSTLAGSINGVVGNNRHGQNSCFFESQAIDPALCPDCPFQPGDLGWARPLDDDLDNDLDGQFDEFVTASGPIRNMDIRAVDGPDMRYDKLEDLYGDTGETFQGALTFSSYEQYAGGPQLPVSYGVGVDDVVVQWREFTVVPDETSCSSGSCAAIRVQGDNIYELESGLTISVLETTPEAANDCDLDGSADGTTDCDGDGIRDVVVRAISDAEPDGEIVVANATGDPSKFEAHLPLTTAVDRPGVLKLAPVPADDSRYPPVDPTVTVIYLDLDDGTGSPCNNSPDPTRRGRLAATTTIRVAYAAADVRVIATVLADNGDDDGFADTNETVELDLTVWNAGDVDLTGLVAYLSTDDPKIDCTLRSTVPIGDLAANAETSTPQPFVFRVADVDRTTLGLTDLDELSASFEVSFVADQFDVNSSSQMFTLDLDLDPAGGSGPTTWFEGFESGTFGSFAPMNLDAGRNSLGASDGYRCQYHDPDWRASSSYGVITDCYLGANPAQADAYFWQVHGPSAVDGGKAFSGSYSLYMGIFGAAADEHTTPMAVLEAIGTSDPINLAYQGAGPELSFKHQVDFMDNRNVGAPFGEGPDRGIVSVQRADAAGAPSGSWTKIQPYLNTYDQRGVDNYFNCTFDPVDDGNTEDDFFDPTDPNRRFGPSSTCKPELDFIYQGDTFFPYSEDRWGAAADGPGLQGSLGVGTWIEAKFNLERFRGRRLRLRFLNTSLKAGNWETWEEIFTFNPAPGDDGWWIDDVQVTGALTEPATMSNDDKPNTALPGCGNTCNVITATLDASPSSPLPAPGQVVELSAIDSVADRCLDGLLQARFWADGDGDGDGGGTDDRLLRDWGDDFVLVQAPFETTTYLAEVRCSSDPSCVDLAGRQVVVDCPSSGNLAFPDIVATGADTFDWGSAVTFDYAAGSLAEVSSYTTSSTGQSLGPASSFDTTGDQPAAGAGLWYLFRSPGPLGQGASGYCNAPGNTWGNSSRDGILP